MGPPTVAPVTLSVVLEGKHGGWWRGHLSHHCVCEEGGADGVEAAPGLLLC